MAQTVSVVYVDYVHRISTCWENHGDRKRSAGCTGRKEASGFFTLLGFPINALRHVIIMVLLQSYARSGMILFLLKITFVTSCCKLRNAQFLFLLQTACRTIAGARA